MFLPSAQRRMSAVGRMEKQTAHPNPNLEPIEKPHVAYRVSRGTTPAYTPHERRTKWQRTLPDRTRTSIRVRPLLKLGSHQTTKQLRNRARPAGAEPRWPPKAVYRQRPAGGPDAKKGDFYEWLEETHFRSTGPDRRVCDGQPGSLREGA